MALFHEGKMTLDNSLSFTLKHQTKDKVKLKISSRIFTLSSQSPNPSAHRPVLLSLVTTHAILDCQKAKVFLTHPWPLPIPEFVFLTVSVSL